MNFLEILNEEKYQYRNKYRSQLLRILISAIKKNKKVQYTKGEVKSLIGRLSKGTPYVSWSTPLNREISTLFGVSTKFLSKVELIKRLETKKASRAMGPESEVKVGDEFKYNLFRLPGSNNTSYVKLFNEKFKKTVEPFRNEPWFEESIRKLKIFSSTHLKSIGAFFYLC